MTFSLKRIERTDTHDLTREQLSALVEVARAACEYYIMTEFESALQLPEVQRLQRAVGAFRP